jgi:hypothetical protein|uniref:Uncharacterized protein n=1 Tax=Ignisphaera aggregans TaxID=334771 RepID=A0A7J2U201_9CREN
MSKVKLIIMSSSPEDLWKCSKVANKVKRIASKYIDVEILLSTSTSTGIAINGEEIVSCNQEDDAIDNLLAKIAMVSGEENTKGVAVAAATLESW